jgi:hypothetical protein
VKIPQDDLAAQRLAVLRRIGILLVQAPWVIAADNATFVGATRALTDLDDSVLGLGQPITGNARFLVVCRDRNEGDPN